MVFHIVPGSESADVDRYKFSWWNAKNWTASLKKCILLLKYLLEYVLTQNKTLEILFT